MNTRRSLLVPVFTCVMLVFVLFMLWYVPSVSSRRFELADAELSLETSRGRERKQQYEYEQAAAGFDPVRAELAQVQPKTEAAKQKVDELKALRKELRQEKKELESRLDATAQEGKENE